MFRVGDRVVCIHDVWYNPAIITKITDRGFQYEYIKPVPMGTRIGVCTGGQTFAPDFWKIDKEKLSWEVE